jgi:hypothetical protein
MLRSVARRPVGDTPVARPDHETISQAVVALLTEAYAGPPSPSETWFIDNGPVSGILGQLAKLSAAVASKSADASGQPEAGAAGAAGP